MEARITYTPEDLAKVEIQQFVSEGLKDVYDNNLFDFNSTFDELEKGIPMNNNTYQIVMTRQAKQDVIDIGDYITYTLLDPDTSRHFIRNLRKAISTLSSFPYKYPLIQDNILAEQGIRCMPHHNYYIFYKIIADKNIVIIVRIGYHRRNWKNLL